MSLEPVRETGSVLQECARPYSTYNTANCCFDDLSQRRISFHCHFVTDSEKLKVLNYLYQFLRP
jgi:hypothetical protein